MIDVKSVLNFAVTNQRAFEQDLIECLKISSISTIKSHSNSINECADLVLSHLKTIGLTNVKQYANYGYPIIYADNGFDSTKPTILFYGHYDVQPVDPLHLWSSDPFDPELRDGYIFARGASDNKGMFYSQIKAVESYIKTFGDCPVNVKFLIEGEEEIGSKGLTQFINDHQDVLSHDVLLVSDSPKFSSTVPSICKSIRGLVYLEVTVEALPSDVHSGQLGGGVPNVIHYISDCISSLKDSKTNQVLIPGFYDDVIDSDIPIDQFILKKELALLDNKYNLGDHANIGFFENIWFLPTLDCNGISSGFIEEGAKTVIPARGSFKLSARLVGNQDPQKVFKLIQDYIADFFPKSFDCSIKQLGPLAKPMSVDVNNLFFQTAIKSLELTHEKPILVQGEGGSIPILAEFKDIYGKPIVLIGLNAPDDNIHAPNERFKRTDFLDGIKIYIYYIYLLANANTNKI